MYNNYYGSGYGSGYGSSNSDVIAMLDGTFWAILIVQIISTVACLIICAKIADRKGRSVGGWVFGGIALGWIAVIILACLSDLNSYTPTVGRSNSLVRRYMPYTCSNCKRQIDTKTCDVCGYSNPDNLLIPYANFTNSLPNNRAHASNRENAQKFWYCDCGAKNAEGTVECSNCFARKKN
ncbi:MAG: hypothetical protein J6B12_00495 [Clostridia bacterium]|nr:hypothetical protein [Clostridia bacterium]